MTKDMCIILGGERLKNKKCSLDQDDIEFAYNVESDLIDMALFSGDREIRIPEIADVIIINGMEIGFIDGYTQDDGTVRINEMELAKEYRGHKLGIASMLAYIGDQGGASDIYLWKPKEKHIEMWSQLGETKRIKDGLKIHLRSDVDKFYLQNIL